MTPLARWTRGVPNSVLHSRRGAAGLAKVVLALIAAGIGTVSVVRVAGSRPAAPAARMFFTGDTTYYLGPVQRSGTASPGTTYLDRLTIAVSPGQFYKLRVV